MAEFIHQHESVYRVNKMCQALNVSSSGYYQWRHGSESERSLQNRTLLFRIRQIHSKSRSTYGSPRITAELRSQGTCVNHKRVERLMSKNDVRARRRKKYKVTTQSKHAHPVAPNLIQGNFAAGQPNELWLSDITYIWTREGWLYLAAILDACVRDVVGWSVRDRLNSKLVVQAIKEALVKYPPANQMIFHSDRGSQYASQKVQHLLNACGITPSMSSTGNCYDNAMVESFFRTLKTECIYGKTFSTRQQAREELFEYIEVFYNRQRRHSAIGYKTPAEYRELANCS